ITRVTDDDIRQLRDRGRIDIICGGFPCQAFSIAGKRKGFDDTRGTLFFEIARFANIIRPRYLFLENVKGLLNHDNGNTFETILGALDELGYDVEWDLLNSKDFGVPQNRERVFVVGHLRNERGRKVFPVGGIDGETDSSIMKVGNIRKNGRSQSGNVFSAEGLSPTLCSSELQKDPVKIIRPVLTPDRAEKRQNGRRFKEDGEPMFTLTSQDRHGVAIKEATKKGYDIAEEGDSVNFQFPESKTRRGRVGKQIANSLEASNINQGVLVGVGHHPLSKKKEFNGYSDEVTPCLIATDYKAPKTAMFKSGEEYRIRKLTPKETWRLQGFPDELFDKAQKVNSDSQLYKQAGNSVTVNVIHAIAERLEVTS